MKIMRVNQLNRVPLCEHGDSFLGEFRIVHEALQRDMHIFKMLAYCISCFTIMLPTTDCTISS